MKPRYIVKTGTAEVPAGKVVYKVDEWAEPPFVVAMVSFMPCGRAPHRQIALHFLEPWPYDAFDEE